MARRDPAELQRTHVELQVDPETARAREVAASVDSDAIVRLARTAPAHSGGRRPVNVAISDELYALFEERLGTLSKRSAVEQLIAGFVHGEHHANGANGAAR